MRVWISLFVLCLVSPSSVADGKFFSRALTAPTVPDQRALIAWDGAEETLVVDTAVNAPPGELAWVIPLPAPPRIEAVEPGLFETLESITAPTIDDRGPLGLLSHLRPFLLLFLVPPLLIAVLVPPVRVTSAWGAFAVALLVALLLAALVLPVLASAGAGGTVPAGNGLTLVSAHRVGAFETTTVVAQEADDLERWLLGQGFEIGANDRAVIEKLVGDGWCFVVSRLRADDAGGLLRPHPLAFRFPAKRVVYPLALTGVNNGPLLLRLFVFGPSEAMALPLQRTLSLPTSHPDTQERATIRIPNESVPLAHVELAGLVETATWCTVLESTLPPSAQATDLAIDWTDGASFRPRLFTGRAVSDTALNVMTLFLVIAAPLALHWRTTRPRLIRERLLVVLAVLAAGVAIRTGVAATMPHVESRRVLIPTLSTHGHRLAREAKDAVEGLVDSTRDRIEAVILAHLREKGRSNPWTGQPVEISSSPGNILVRERADGAIELLVHDVIGRPEVTVIRPAFNTGAASRDTAREPPAS